MRATPANPVAKSALVGARGSSSSSSSGSSSGSSRRRSRGAVLLPAGRQALPQSRGGTAPRCCSGDARQVSVSTTSKTTVEQALQDAGVCLGSSPDVVETALITPQGNSYSWEDWQQLASAVAQDEAQVCLLRERLAAAVREERYADAMAAKQQLSDLLARDYAHVAQEELDAAVAEERYGDAAAVRDNTGVGLQGWWSGGAEDDPCGHLLYISRVHGRFLARAYTPSNLAEMKGWTEANPLRQDEELMAVPTGNLGQSVMEFYLQKNAQHEWEQQAVVLPDSPDAASLLSWPDSSQPGGALQAHVDTPDQPCHPAPWRPATLLNITRNQFMVVPEVQQQQQQQQRRRRRQQEEAALPPQAWDGSSDEPSSSTATCQDLYVSSSSNASEFAVMAEGSNDSIRIPLSEFLKSLDEDQSNPEVWNKVADAVAEMQERISAGSAGENGADKIPRAELADGIRQAIEKLVEAGSTGEEMSVKIGPTAPSEDPTSIRQAVVTKPAAYVRVSTTRAVPTDPLSGLYLGAFGPHGPEVLNVTRVTAEDGSPAVEGIKITGDQNVPAGQISFRVKVGREHKMANDSEYPEELGVAARYKGEGCVAQPGFTNPKWVEGELLVFSSHGAGLASSVTGGAELGFVWSMPDEKKFLILMNRVNLNDLVDDQSPGK